MYTIDRKELTVAEGCSDGSELASVEVPELIHENDPEQNIPLTSGYTVDDRGLLNNYAILPPMYIEEPNHPTVEEKLRSKSQMIFAILFVAIAVLIALVIS